jgi:hypothetical protein
MKSASFRLDDIKHIEIKQQNTEPMVMGAEIIGLYRRLAPDERTFSRSCDPDCHPDCSCDTYTHCSSECNSDSQCSSDYCGPDGAYKN